MLKKKGRIEFVVLPYEEYAAIKDELEDLQDLRDLRAASHAERHKTSLTVAQVRRQLKK
jgi:hypothetical protein